jgi:hypothetical protein
MQLKWVEFHNHRSFALHAVSLSQDLSFQEGFQEHFASFAASGIGKA